MSNASGWRNGPNGFLNHHNFVRVGRAWLWIAGMILILAKFGWLAGLGILFTSIAGMRPAE